jgi:hypothetical protein
VNSNYICHGNSTTALCSLCEETFELPVSQAQIDTWSKGGLIQRVMPQLTKDQRELLISGTCGPCFEELFGGGAD